MDLERGPRQLSRNIEMERRKRIYRSMSLEESLIQAGVDTNKINPEEQHRLPLEIFDDEEYDCRYVLTN